VQAVKVAPMIRPADLRDAADIARIYDYYTRNTVITFEERPVPEAEMAARISAVRSSGLPWLVAERDANPVGFAYAGEWKGRCAYRHSVEITVYLDPGHRGEGWGTRLYEALFTQLRQGTTHVAIAGIALPNPQSIALHEKFGMTKVAHFTEVGFKFDRWIDVGYWQLVLDGPGAGMRAE
jgi:phosphinothricin acetyltransferase